MKFGRLMEKEQTVGQQTSNSTASCHRMSAEPSRSLLPHPIQQSILGPKSIGNTVRWVLINTTSLSTPPANACKPRSKHPALREVGKAMSVVMFISSYRPGCVDQTDPLVRACVCVLCCVVLCCSVVCVCVLYVLCVRACACV